MNKPNEKVIAEFSGREFLQLLQKSDIRMKISQNAKIKILSIEDSPENVPCADADVPVPKKVDILKEVSELLHSFGMPANIKGYAYVRSAIVLAIEDPEVLESITKVLYPKVAEKYNTTPSRVERGIRHAIEVTWDRGIMKKVDEVFGYAINVDKGKPTNSEFVAGITDYLRINLHI